MSDAQLIQPEELKERLDEPNLVVVDCRFEPGNSEAGEQHYRKDHIPNAVYLSLEKDLSGEIKKHGGRHPLPDLKTFCHKLGEVGIDQSTRVVAYDNQAGAMAARLWWLLTYLGHPNIALLDGGYDGWREKGYPVSNVIPTPKHTVFTPYIQPDWIADMDEVKQALSHAVPLIDSRAPERYSGKNEPIDQKAGHIPGAYHVFWKNNLNANQQWKSLEQLQKHFSFLSANEQPIVYCGSGVTACVNVFALKRIGFRRVKLYIGSWSDWISYEDNPIA